jgi:NAD(P)-dependent dehydrogenase (short-subunit alcohol dehydrogenase family)
LTTVADDARAAGATAYHVGCDLARLSDVRAAAQQITDMLEDGTLRPLHGLIANAGVMVADNHTASQDGYELTFAVNYLAHAQLIGDLLPSFATPGRIVLLGSNTYYQNVFRRIIGVPPADWHNPTDLAQPLPADQPASFKASGTAYANSKLAILYYAHELQRHTAAGIDVIVFEPGFMPGTGLSRDRGAAMQRAGRALQAIPGVSSPKQSGPSLASVAIDARWAHLRNGAFVVKNKERPVQPVAHDPAREHQLFAATAELLHAAKQRSRDHDTTHHPEPR